MLAMRIGNSLASRRCQRKGSSPRGFEVGSGSGRAIGVRLMEVPTELSDPIGEEM